MALLLAGGESGWISCSKPLTQSQAFSVSPLPVMTNLIVIRLIVSISSTSVKVSTRFKFVLKVLLPLF